MLRKKQFTGLPFPGILHQKAQHVSAPERGISFERPERYVVNTPFGQQQIAHGDWLVIFPSGNCYVFKDVDIVIVEPKKPKEKRWKFWRKS